MQLRKFFFNTRQTLQAKNPARLSNFSKSPVSSWLLPARVNRLIRLALGAVAASSAPGIQARGNLLHKNNFDPLGAIKEALAALETDDSKNTFVQPLASQFR